MMLDLLVGGVDNEGMELESQTANQEREANTNLRMPVSLKKQVKSFCVQKEITVKDFFIFAAKALLEKYEKMDSEEKPS